MPSPQSNRLRFVPLARLDLQDLFALRSDPLVMQYWDRPGDSSPRQTSQALEMFLAEVASGDALHWCLRTRNDNQFAGCCDLSNLHSPGAADVGFMLARRYWGRGLGGELLDALITQARGMRLPALEARIHSENLRSRRLLMGCGFLQTSSSAAYEILPGVFRSCTWFHRLLL